MYNPHDKVTVPAEDTIIWRYVDLARFVAMLESNSLWFSSIGVLANFDQWEGVFHRTLREFWHKQTGVFQNLESSQQLIHKQAFANCWHMNENESDAMWKLYSNGGSNVVIRSTFSRLSSAVDKAPEVISIGEVQYIDHANHDYSNIVDGSPSVKIMNIALVVLWKRSSFAHERELRAFFFTGKPERGEESFGKPVFVNLKSLIEEIRVSPRSDPWFHELIERIMERYGFQDVPVKRSSMEDEPDK